MKKILWLLLALLFLCSCGAEPAEIPTVSEHPPFTVEQKDGQTMVSCWWGEGKRRTERYVLIYRDGKMAAIGSYANPQSSLKTSPVLEWSQSVPDDFRMELPKI